MCIASQKVSQESSQLESDETSETGESLDESPLGWLKVGGENILKIYSEEFSCGNFFCTLVLRFMVKGGVDPR